MSGLTKNSGRWVGTDMWNWGAAVFWGRTNVKEGCISVRARTRKRALWGKAEPEYNEWIYENGKFTEISAASLPTGVREAVTFF